jgi:hypothetical protein
MAGARARRRTKRLPVTSPSAPFTLSELLAAACTVYPYEASRMLDVRKPGNLNEVPDQNYFLSIFNFSKADVLKYVEGHPGLAETLEDKSLDQRCTPSAFMARVGSVYSVGWSGSDGRRSQVRFHKRIEDAAADFVLAFWGMER